MTWRALSVRFYLEPMIDRLQRHVLAPVAEALFPVGPARYYSPCHRMPCNSRNEGYTCV